MNKAIILLSGTPSGKNYVIDKAREHAWVWNINHKNLFLKNLELVYKNDEQDGELENGDEQANESDMAKIHSFISAVSALANKFFGFEGKYYRRKIKNFLRDTDFRKEDKQGKSFDSFLLIMHGVSRNLSEDLKSEYGIFHIHVDRQSFHTETTNIYYDKVLFEDEFDFDEKVNTVLKILLQEGEGFNK